MSSREALMNPDVKMYIRREDPLNEIEMPKTHVTLSVIGDKNKVHKVLKALENFYVRDGKQSISVGLYRTGEPVEYEVEFKVVNGKIDMASSVWTEA